MAKTVLVRPARASTLRNSDWYNIQRCQVAGASSLEDLLRWNTTPQPSFHAVLGLARKKLGIKQKQYHNSTTSDTLEQYSRH
jgi:hypothetical protein